MQLLESCCLCVSLKNACITTGIAGIIFSILTVAGSFTSFIKFRSIEGDISPFLTKFIVIVNTLIWITISILLIVGTLKKKRKLFVPWLILSLCLMAGCLISAFYAMVLQFGDKKYASGITTIVIAIIVIMLFLYLWLVVYSYYQKIRNVGIPFRK